MEAGAHPEEAIVCLDELQSEQALRHPVEAAVDTVAQAFAESAPVRFLARPGHEREYMHALLNLSRAEQPYEVHEAGDFGCVALVHEVPPAAAGAAGEAEEEVESEEGTDEEAEARGPLPRPSRAEASANVKPPAQHGGAAQRGAAGGSWQKDSEQLRAAMERGSVEALLELGVPRLDAEMLVHVRPERYEAYRQVVDGLEARMEAYAKDHGPLLHLHFLATRPSERGLGRGRDLLHHLERMADAEGRRLYLEATSLDNRRLYLRHGFRDVGEFQVGSEADALVFYLMARPPGAKSLPPSATDLQAAGQPAGAAAAGKGAAGRAAVGEGTLLGDEL